MNNALSNLSEHVREAYDAFDAVIAPAGNVSYEAYKAWGVVSNELLRVTAERDALRKRIEEAPSTYAHHDDGDSPKVDDFVPAEWVGKRVRLVLDD